jgi:ABC-type bacteriocin/lantibiotic exporter with double-glycine peptidase domain
MKFRPIKQSDTSACGPAAIEVVTRYFGIKTSATDIKRIAKYKNKEGMSNSNIVRTLRLLHLKVQEKPNASWESLKKFNSAKRAIIVSWMLKGYIGHVSVVEKITDTYIFLADSVKGEIIKLPKLIFLRLWMDYDEIWYPKKLSDIQLRWMALISK